MLVHVRDYTKGHPSIAANNHPVRHGAVVGIHNGIIVNDDELFAHHGFARAEPRDDGRLRGDLRARRARAGRARGRSSSSAARWRRRGSTSATPARSSLARGVGRPLWLGTGGTELFFASTERALEVLEQLLPADAPQARARRGHAARASKTARVAAHATASGRTARSSRRRSCRRSARRTRASPASSASRRSPRGRLALAPSVPSGATSTPSSRSRSRTRNWNVAHAPRRDVEHPVDLPLGQQRLVGSRARRPSRRTSAAGRASARASAPCSTARSSRSSPTGTSKPASRSAFVSEPNVCQ